MIIYREQLLNSRLKNKGIGEIGRFCIDDSKSYYPFTHLLKPVFDFYNFYNKETNLIEFLLLNPVNESGGLLLETTKRQDIMKNKNFIEVSKKIFYDDENREIKRGSTNAIKRLIDLFKQYERTYDLYSMPSKMILEKLISKHKEFDKFESGSLSKSF